MRALGVLSFLLLTAQLSFAALLPTKFVFERLVENNGTQPITIENEVIIGENDKPSLKEIWRIENSRNMQLTVINLETQMPIHHVIVKNGQKIISVENHPRPTEISAEFLERLHHFRSISEVTKYFSYLGLVPDNVLTANPYGSLKDKFTYKEEPYVRLGRTNGVVSYVYGASQTTSNKAGLWVEQDAFLTRKIRLPSGAELSLNDYTELAKGHFYPKIKKFVWEDKVVTIRLKNSSAKAAPTSTLTTNNWSALSDSSVKEVAEEFYSRFR